MVRERASDTSWLVRFVLESAFAIIIVIGGAYVNNALGNLNKSIEDTSTALRDESRKREQLQDRFDARTDRFAAIEARQAASDARDVAQLEVLNGLRNAVEELRRDLARHTYQTGGRK